MVVLVIFVLAVIYVLSSIRIVRQWEEMVLFTLGRFTGVRRAGLTVVWRFIQRGLIIDKRVTTTEFRTEGTLSKDKVPVTLLAVLFWKVQDVTKAALEVQNYRATIDLAAQTTLRDVVSRSDLEQLLSDQRKIDEQIASSIRERAQSWGVEVQNVEIRDIEIPSSLQDVLSRKAQAQAEKEARRIYGEAEVVAAEEFLKAAQVYETSPIAFRLRGLNVLLEAVKSDRNTLLFIPTEVTDMLRSVGPLLQPPSSSPKTDVTGPSSAAVPTDMPPI
ncbi:band 7 protein [Sulfobacillus acidophilus DSM 10332]|uniref:Band 7 protein n=1 Tax=Sulfobacillus acidophilus (strain ATCC 700253 / DSM 10332 / NAL) TaxID=679936 RepID=G8TSR6_SULAD|nr:band 7 protein [Sulfobacillus acidophilus DSM 10332]